MRLTRMGAIVAAAAMGQLAVLTGPPMTPEQEEQLARQRDEARRRAVASGKELSKRLYAPAQGRGRTYPYSSQRQSERYTRQVAEGRLKAENGLVSTGS